ncbi:peptidoglycan DD-metalloendopeptidase family protein [Candidatus Aerophobetes bacterium]|nr:peptidoglycan DD-metalloendopeptidase family protein [Candidatus Aerophobetes bacterium]
MAEKSKFFTVVVIPNSHGKVRRLVIPRFLITTGIIGLIVCFFALFYFISEYQIVKAKIPYFEALEELTQIQQERIVSLSEKIAEFGETLDRLKEMEDKLKTMAGAGGKNIALEDGSGKGGPEQYMGGSLPFQSFPLQEIKANPIQIIDEMKRDLQLLSNEAILREKNFTQINEIIKEKEALFASTPNIFPVKGWLSSGYGSRINPFTGRRETHEAIDIVAPWDTPVRAACRGEVVFAGWRDFYGLVVEIKNKYGYSTLYAHLSKVLVKKGERVEKGQIVGRVGSTGRSTGPHLHFEVWKGGRSIDPLKLMVEPLN